MAMVVRHELAMACGPAPSQTGGMATVIEGLVVAPLSPGDRGDWERLARGYHEFYSETVAAHCYDATWARLMLGLEIHALGAFAYERLVGIAHYVLHPHVWLGEVCYLQDLFVDSRVRGSGVGRALIEHVAIRARERGAFRLYWVTTQENGVARVLYDKVACLTPYIRYDRSLS